jgi:hypothetical protein
MPFGTINHGHEIARDYRRTKLPSKIATFIAHRVLDALVIAAIMVVGAAFALSMLG